VAITIPIIPQIMDTTAPIKKATAVQMPCPVRKVIMMNMIMMNMKQMAY
jgi:hypothetical protein